MAKMLASHSMRFGTDNFGWKTDASTGAIGNSTITGGGSKSTITSDNGTTTIADSSTFTLSTGGGGSITVTDNGSGTVTISGGGSETIEASGGNTDYQSIQDSAGKNILVQGAGGRNVAIYVVLPTVDDDGDMIDETDGTTSSNGSAVTATFLKTALLKGTHVWLCKNKSAVLGFDIKGQNYNYNSDEIKCRFVFRHSGDSSKYYTLRAEQNPDTGKIEGKLCEFNYPMGNDTDRLKSILEHGNHVGDIYTIESIPEFVGYNISPFYALQAPSNSVVVPSIRLDLKTEVATNNNVKVVETEIYPLAVSGTAPIVTDVIIDDVSENNASVTVLAQTFDLEGNGSGWKSIDSIINSEAYSIQFQITYNVTAINGDNIAKLNSICVKHTYGEILVKGMTSDLYTVANDYEVPLQMCYVVVRHDRINEDSEIEAYVNFMRPTKRREMLNVGSGTGEPQEIILGKNKVADPNIVASSLRLYATRARTDDPILLRDDQYSFSSDTGVVTTTISKNVPIYASYDYDHDAEDWLPMTKETTQPLNDADGRYSTRFTYALPDAQAQGKTKSSVLIRLKRKTGTVTKKTLGTGNTHRQVFLLDHVPDVSTIKFVNELTDKEDSSNRWSYDENLKTLSVWADKGKTIIVSYSWQGEEFNIYSVACGWSIA